MPLALKIDDNYTSHLVILLFYFFILKDNNDILGVILKNTFDMQYTLSWARTGEYTKLVSSILFFLLNTNC